MNRLRVRTVIRALAGAMIALAGSAILHAAFPDAHDMPPAGWTGPVFKLSHDYPATMPTCSAPWLKRNVSFTDPNPNWEQWRAYLQDVVDYVWEGQDPDLPDKTGWNVVVNGSTRWFHMPWMATDRERGREFVHGLTNELSTAESSFRGGGRGSGKHTLEGAAPVDIRSVRAAPSCLGLQASPTSLVFPNHDCLLRYRPYGRFARRQPVCLHPQDSRYV